MTTRPSPPGTWGRVIAGLARVTVRIVIAVVIYDIARAALATRAGAEALALAAGGLLAGAITIVIGKFLYDTFLPDPRAP